MENLVKAQDYLKLKIKDTYRLAHSYRVANIGKEIAEKEGLNVDDLMIACLLHDVSYCTSFKTQEEWQNHGRISSKMVREFLESIDYSKERIQNICYAIAIHVDLKADFEGEYNAFTLSVQEADNIDRVGAYRLYETLEAVHFSKQPLEVQIQYVDSMLQTLNEYASYKCTTQTAQALWQDRIQFQLDYFERLKDQLKISTAL